MPSISGSGSEGTRFPSSATFPRWSRIPNLPQRWEMAFQYTYLQYIYILTAGNISFITPLSTQIIHSKSMKFDQYMWCLSQTPHIFQNLWCLSQTPQQIFSSSKFVVFESNTTYFSKTRFEFYFVIVFMQLCLHLCLFVPPFVFSPSFAQFAVRCAA